MSRECQDPRGRGYVKHCNGGFSLLELVVVIVIISVLLVLAISRLLALMVDAERVTMETVAGTLRSAIGMKVAESIVKSKVSELPAFEGSNPMALLAETPRNYLGELDGADPIKLEDGNWYFDKRDKDFPAGARQTRRSGPYGAPFARPDMRMACNCASSHVLLRTGAPVPHRTR